MVLGKKLPEDLTKSEFDGLLKDLQNYFKDRVSKEQKWSDGVNSYWQYSKNGAKNKNKDENKGWWIQIKTIWDDCEPVHYEVVYEKGKPQEGVRVELHIEKYGDNKKYGGNNEKRKELDIKAGCLDGFLLGEDSYLKTKNVDRDEWQYNHRWIMKKNIGIIVEDGEIKYDNIKSEFNKAIKIFDPLISQFLLKDKCDELAELLKSNHNLILTGAPGTGKTYLAKQIASQIILKNMEGDEVKNSNIADYCDFVQFHPSYDYTDFVEGLRPCIQKPDNPKANTSQDSGVELSPDPQTKSGNNGNIGFELRPGVFKEFCDNAKAYKDKNYVFIIDEINRGDISKIFGELFFSIDPEYRGEKGAVETQYSTMHKSDDKFYVPENVYIIGTMNDIDRSVESMDFAMRRRFSWREITAKESAVTMGLPKPLIDKMNNLNVAIDNTEGLNSSFHIGGAYFLDKDEDYNDIWEMRLEPLLREYLRGQPNIEAEIKRLKAAYDGKNSKDEGNPSENLAGLTGSITGEDLLKKLFDKPHNHRIWEMGDCQFGGDFWYIQVKTIWDNDVDIHYEVIYDARKDIEGVNEEYKYKDEGVRVELHLEGKYRDIVKENINEFCNYLLIKITEADKGNLTWEDWKEYGREHNGRCKYIAEKIESVDVIVEGFKYLMKVFDPLLAKYQPKMLKTRLEKAHNLILTGAPGTGKTYLARQIAKQMIGVEKDEELNGNEQYGFVQFHPSYDYTDFVEGLRPCIQKQNNKKANTSQYTEVESSPDPQTKSGNNGNIGFELRAGVFKKFCDKAKTYKYKKYVFIIDEINRGDISKIFGELFFSIDPGYRGEKGAVETQYSNMHKPPKEKFYVPENVYIIGTMNDIDRSVESMDFAMRRRFTWQEIKAKDTQHMLDDLSNDEKMKGKNKMDPAGIQLAKDRMDNLNDKISDEKGIGLNSAYHIGASYFMKLANYGDKNPSVRFEKLWKNHLEGVLREYLRGDDKIEGKMGKLKDAYDNNHSTE